MSDKLIDQIDFELGQLRQLLAEGRELIEGSKRENPKATSRWALGAILHAFYNGVENILKRIAVAYNEKPEKSGQWHIDLLSQMAEPNKQRPPVISPELQKTLRQYLAFRHIFRSIYTHELRWDAMAKLVSDVDAVFERISAELTCFRDKISHTPDKS